MCAHRVENVHFFLNFLALFKYYSYICGIITLPIALGKPVKAGINPGEKSRYSKAFHALSDHSKSGKFQLSKDKEFVTPAQYVYLCT